MAVKKTDLGPGGWATDWRTKRGVIREDLLMYGSLDKLRAYPIIVVAVFRAFQNTVPAFGG
jgi:hypothetical protein